MLILDQSEKKQIYVTPERVRRDQGVHGCSASGDITQFAMSPQEHFIEGHINLLLGASCSMSPH